MDMLQRRHSSTMILVIEDNAAQRKTLLDILELEGLHPIECVSGQDALEACQHYDVHVAVLDLNLPDMTGIEVLNRLKQITPAMKVIINTAYPTLESAMDAVNQEAFAYVQKMGDVEELLGHIHRAFHAHLTGYSARLEEEVETRTRELVAANESLRQEIAERQRVEAEIRRLNTELEQHVQRRTAGLEAANKELKDFAYVVSHDLKTPLRGISRLAQWLVQDYAEAFDTQGQEMVVLLTNRVKRMDRLIDGILEYSRVGRIIEQEQAIDLIRLVHEVVDLLTPPETIRVVIPPDLPVITGDKIRIFQVFQNLVSNAVKFMDTPEGTVTISWAASPSHWTFRVADTGPGIDPKYHTKVFQIFQTITSRGDHENTGIGLALVKKIVELHGGAIWIETTPGQRGTTVCFTLSKHSPAP